MSDDAGFIWVRRGFLDHPFFAPEPLSEREAFLWMIGEAAWKDRTRRLPSTVVELRRGQLVHSTRFMAAAWKWSEARVRRYLKRLKIDAMIDAQSDAHGTLVTICNYDKYQSRSQEVDAPTDAESDATVTHPRRTGDANKNHRTKITKETSKQESSSGAGEDQGFEEFYHAYPRHVGRGQARTAYAKAIRKTSATKLLSGALAYASSVAGKDPKFIPHPATWLNGERWADEGGSGNAEGPRHDDDWSRREAEIYASLR